VLAPEYTPLGEIYQYRLTSDRHNLYELRSEQEWVLSTQFRQVEGRRRRRRVRRLHPRGPRRGRSGAPRGVRPDARRCPPPHCRRATSTSAVASCATATRRWSCAAVGYLYSGARHPERRASRARTARRSRSGTSRGSCSRTSRGEATPASTTPKEIIEGFVLLRRGENPSIVLDGVHRKVEELNTKILPKGMKVEVFYDRSTLVSHTLGTGPPQPPVRRPAHPRRVLAVPPHDPRVP